MCEHHGHPKAEDDKSGGINLDKIVDRSIKRMYEGKTTPGQPDAELVRAEAEHLWKGVKKGWNTNGENIKFGSQEQRLLVQMRHNTFVTSVFKRHHFALDMGRELFDSKGEIRSFSEFRKAVKDKVEPKYNVNWLRTEYNTAYASGQMARKWQTYVKKGGFISYVAVMDGRTRYDHGNMNGARYPVDHPFWHNHFPPNGWNCRCTTRWDGTEGEAVPPKGIDDVPPTFQNNVGITGQVFKDLPYFNVDGSFAAKAENLFGLKPPVDPVKYEANLQLFNSLSEDKNFKLVATDNLSGGFIFKGLKKANDYEQNLAAAKKLFTRGDSIVIRDVVNQHGVKNADVLLNGELAEIKTNRKGTSNSIDKQLQEGKDQSEHIILDVVSNIKPSVLEDAIYNRVRRTSKIKSLTVIYGDVVTDLTEDEIKNQTFYGKIGRD